MELLAKNRRRTEKRHREKNENAKDAIRMLLASLKVKEKEIRRQPIETEIHQMISTLINQRHDSV